MSDTTISWTEKSWNPIAAFDRETGKRGWFCVHASEGCMNCYAEARNRWIGNRHRYRAQDAKNVAIRIAPKQLHEPRTWRERKRVFVCSMTDLFYEGHSDEIIDTVFEVMVNETRHTYQVLTKRAERMRDYIVSRFGRTLGCPPHIWLGNSAENQKAADARIPFLLETPTAVRWVSYEPALGPIDFDRGSPSSWVDPQCARCSDYRTRCYHLPRLNWIVVGGESGLGARTFHLEWARNTVGQCRAAGVAAFVKQLGAHPVDNGIPLPALVDAKGENPDEWPEDLRVREYPQVAA